MKKKKTINLFTSLNMLTSEKPATKLKLVQLLAKYIIKAEPPTNSIDFTI